MFFWIFCHLRHFRARSLWKKQGPFHPWSFWWGLKYLIERHVGIEENYPRRGGIEKESPSYSYLALCMYQLMEAEGTLIKNKIKFSSYIRWFRRGMLQMQMQMLHMRKSILLYEEMGKYLVIRRPLVIVIFDFASAPFWIYLYLRKILFYFLSVWIWECCCVCVTVELVSSLYSTVQYWVYINQPTLFYKDDLSYIHIRTINR